LPFDGEKSKAKYLQTLIELIMIPMSKLNAIWGEKVKNFKLFPPLF